MGNLRGSLEKTTLGILGAWPGFSSLAARHGPTLYPFCKLTQGNTVITKNLPPAPAIGVGAVVFDARGRVLLIRRGKPPAQGRWSLPGGRLEPGETLVECCAREVLEETAIAIAPGPVVALAERRVEGFHYVIVDFLAAPLAPGPPEPAPASDVSAAVWVAVAELAGYDLVDGVREVILAARAGLEAGGGAGLIDSDGTGGLFVAGTG